MHKEITDQYIRKLNEDIKSLQTEVLSASSANDSERLRVALRHQTEAIDCLERVTRAIEKQNRIK